MTEKEIETERQAFEAEAEKYAESLRTAPDFKPVQACKPPVNTKRIGGGVM